MRKILISIMAIVSMSWAVCQPGEIQLQSGICVTDCGKFFDAGGKFQFRACTQNQVGKRCDTRECYYNALPADTPLKRMHQCLKERKNCPAKKRQRSRTHGNPKDVRH